MQNFNCGEFTTLLTNAFVGRKLIYKDVTDTTMDDAKYGGIQGAPSGTIYLTEIQNKARGTKDHKWDALNRGNLYLSIVIHRPPPVTENSFVERFDVEVTGAMSLLCTLHDMSITGACVKWPNDVWVRGHKLAGFLAEHGGILPDSQNDSHLFVLGMGINVNSDMRRHPDLVGIATSIRCENGGAVVSRERVLADVCNKLEYYLSLSHGDLYTEACKFQMFKKGHPVRVHHVIDGIMFPATFEGMEEDWSIFVKDKNGKPIRGKSSDYSLRSLPNSFIYVYSGRLTIPWKARLILNSLKSVVDTSRFSVDALNDEKLKDGAWRRDAVVVVMGELTSGIVDSVGNFTTVQEFTQSGGAVILIKTKADQIFPNLTVPTRTMEQSNNFFQVCYSEDKRFTIIASGSELTYDPDAKSEVIGYYDRQENGSPSAVLVPVDAGKCAILGFDIEITYNDIDIVPNITEPEKLFDPLSKTVVTRDEYFNYVLSKLLNYR
ncbi:uncharacterized protein LOC125683116 [Ostrea edulis]|uniref:uncharacterized protein LOC125683116 n=1 Tax=Ostrea edulis TaxID=37623 RepID=UPI0024AF0169|nr:uncharacterized protein LOC125683116 [Ostrea edulis]XP_048779887.2 uncharacterized protein LOC125683116 [Ostrea edulis]XP_055996342.1 uncharacterized protein LOC125683116 [Ostrea edulis]